MATLVLRTTGERDLTMPGSDVRVQPAVGDSCTLDALYSAVSGSAALGSPFRCTIAGGIVYIDPTDKSKSPYTALQTSLNGACA